MNATRHPPGPGMFGAMNIAPRLMRDPLHTLSSLAGEYGDAYSMRLGPILIYVFTNPDYVKHVLNDQHVKYKKSSMYDEFGVLLGDGQMTTNDMESWRRQRKLILPTFAPAKLQDYARVVADSAESMLDRWNEQAASGSVDIYEEFVRFGLSAIGRILFSIDLAQDAPQVSASMRTAFAHIMKRVTAPAKLPRDFPTPGRVRVRRAVDRLDDIVMRLVRERRESGDDTGDLLSSLALSRDDDGRGMTEEQLRDEIKTLLVAGHESPANALTWACYLLAQHPEAQDRVAQEASRVSGASAPDYADMESLVYTRQVLDETMRLYPPAWTVERTPLQDDTIGDYTVKAGARVNLLMHAIHRHPDHWTDPDRFDPDRFSAERSEGRHKFAYFPYSGGPRVCLGVKLSNVKMAIALAMVVRRFELRLDETHEVVPLPSVNLRPRDGIRLHLTPRVDLASATA
ncbi:MAG: cytochrome P450 [Myxococcales bacterium]|nr:cytochrome P450 [Myxococcales bacterium]